MCDDAERSRKVMPSITTYNSDDSLDELSSSQESELKEVEESVDSSTHPTAEVLPTLSDSNTDSSTDSEDEMLSKISDQFSTVPIADMITSKQFIQLSQRITRRRPKHSSSLSAYAIFFRDVFPVIKADHSDAKFGEIARLINERWSKLSTEEKRDYRKRGSLRNQDTVQPLLVYKTRLLSLNGQRPRRCANPECTNPVIRDPRWNGQYCSTTCVGEHCQRAFNNFFNQSPVQSQTNNTSSILSNLLNSSSDSVNRNIKLEDDNTPMNTNIPAQSSSVPISLKIPKADPDTDGVVYRKPLFESLASSALSLTSSEVSRR